MKSVIVVLNDNTLWVTGGEDQWNRYLKSTEIVTKDGKTSRGPDLPLAVMGHAIVALDSGGAFILIGGHRSTNSKTYLYEKKKGWSIWGPGPTLKFGRWFPTAGLLTDRITTKQYIVAVGGMFALESVEYLEYPGSNVWKEGKLP